jgi:hypothetical protein
MEARIMSVEEAILEKVRALQPQKREEVLKFADSLRAEANADDAEERAVEEARQWLRENGGKGIPREVVLADFGLTMDDFRRMAEERARLRGGSGSRTHRLDATGAGGRAADRP